MGLGTELRPYGGFLPNGTEDSQALCKITVGGTKKFQEITLTRPFVGFPPSNGRNCQELNSSLVAGWRGASQQKTEVGG